MVNEGVGRILPGIRQYRANRSAKPSRGSEKRLKFRILKNTPEEKNQKRDGSPEKKRTVRQLVLRIRFR